MIDMFEGMLLEAAEAIRNLEAERVTHSNETLAQVRARLEHERPESPAQRLRRMRRQGVAA